MSEPVPISPSAQQWDAFLQSQPRAHLLQTTEWGQLKAGIGWSVDRVALEVDSRIIAGAQVLYRRLPWGQTLAYLPKGPAVNWLEPRDVTALMSAVGASARGHRAAFLKIEPDLVDGSEHASLLPGLGLHRGHAVQPRSTVLIDLTPDSDDILAGMKSKWRYNVRLATRKGVSVRQGSRGDLPGVFELMKLTAERDAFAVHGRRYYDAAFDLFVSDAPNPHVPQAVWLLAEHEGNLLAVVVVFALGDRAWYFWGASSNAARNLMPNHLLQWTAISWARERGCKTYDLWGIPDEVGQDPDAYDDPETWGADGLWGVYRFKRGFGGQIERTAGAWDMVISRWGYWLYSLAIRARRSLA